MAQRHIRCANSELGNATDNTLTGRQRYPGNEAIAGPARRRGRPLKNPLAIVAAAAASPPKVAGTLSKNPCVSQGVPSGLRIDTQTVRAGADRDARQEMAVSRVDGINFAVVATREPQHLAIC